ISIGFEIMFQSCKKSFISYFVPQHVKYQTAFIVRKCVKYILLILISEPDQRMKTSSMSGIKISQLFIEQLCLSFMFSIMMIPPQMFAVIGKAFIQSEIGPGLKGNEITKPMMDHLMCHNPVVVIIDQIPLFSLH